MVIRKYTVSKADSVHHATLLAGSGAENKRTKAKESHLLHALQIWNSESLSQFIRYLKTI